MAVYRRGDDLRSPAGWLPVHRDQLGAQRSVWSMAAFTFTCLYRPMYACLFLYLCYQKRWIKMNIIYWGDAKLTSRCQCTVYGVRCSVPWACTCTPVRPRRLVLCRDTVDTGTPRLPVRRCWERSLPSERPRRRIDHRADTSTQTTPTTLNSIN